MTGHAMRFDKALQKRYPHLSLRSARRLIHDGLALRNGAPCRPGEQIKDTDELTIKNRELDNEAPSARLVGKLDNYCFFYKPAGLHTAQLQGRPNDSLEAQLPLIERQNALPDDVILLQRLDHGTGGILAGACALAAAQIFREWEKSEQCRKYYFAVLQGILDHPRQAKNALQASGGKRVKVLNQEAPPIHWTTFDPLAYSEDCTLALCIIAKGKRHQIRAHALSLSLPLLGDPLYSNAPAGSFALEQWRISMPVGEFRYMAEDSLLLHKYPIFRDRIMEAVGCIS